MSDDLHIIYIFPLCSKCQSLVPCVLCVYAVAIVKSVYNIQILSRFVPFVWHNCPTCINFKIKMSFMNYGSSTI